MSRTRARWSSSWPRTPMVERVGYPELEAHPDHALAQQAAAARLRRGVQLRPARARAQQGKRLHRGAEDLLAPGQRRRLPLAGDPSRPRRRTSAWTTRRWRRPASAPGTIRLSIGLEDADDLIDDLKRALKAAREGGVTMKLQRRRPRGLRLHRRQALRRRAALRRVHPRRAARPQRVGAAGALVRAPRLRACWRSTCRATAAAPAPALAERRSDGRLAARRCSTPPACAGARWSATAWAR